MIELPVVLLGILDPSTQVGWATAFGAFGSIETCEAVLAEVLPDYREDWPTAVMWCAEPVKV